MKAVAGLVFAALLGATTVAHADFYIGGGVYATSIDADTGGASSLEEEDVAPAIFLGWRPIEFLGVEAGYYDFGNFESAGSSLEGTAYTLAGLLSVELGPVGVYAKGGVANNEFDFSSAGTSGSESSTDPFGGLGLTVDVMDRLYVYAEYLRFAADAADVDVAGVGLRWNF